MWSVVVCSIIGACIHNLLFQQLYDILKCFDINDLPGLDRFCKHNENIYLVPIYIYIYIYKSNPRSRSKGNP